MKSIMVNKIKKEFGIYKVNGEKLERTGFYNLCGIYKQLKKDKEGAEE